MDDSQENRRIWFVKHGRISSFAWRGTTMGCCCFNNKTPSQSSILWIHSCHAFSSPFSLNSKAKCFNLQKCPVVRPWSDMSFRMIAMQMMKPLYINLSILIRWSITSACASPSSFWQIYCTLSKTEAKDVSSNVKAFPRPPYCIYLQWFSPRPLSFWSHGLTQSPRLNEYFDGLNWMNIYGLN